MMPAEPLTNGAAISGNIALVDRGTCAFTVKVKNAQNAGAIGVIVANNVMLEPVAGMGGVDATIVIPSLARYTCHWQPDQRRAGQHGQSRAETSVRWRTAEDFLPLADGRGFHCLWRRDPRYVGPTCYG